MTCSGRGGWGWGAAPNPPLITKSHKGTYSNEVLPRIHTHPSPAIPPEFTKRLQERFADPKLGSLTICLGSYVASAPCHTWSIITYISCWSLTSSGSKQVWWWVLSWSQAIVQGFKPIDPKKLISPPNGQRFHFFLFWISNWDPFSYVYSSKFHDE